MTKPFLPNPSKATLYMRAWRAAHPGYVEKERQRQKEMLQDPARILAARERVKKWAKDNPEKAKQSAAADHQKHRAKRYRTQKAWMAANIERHRKYQREYQSARQAKVRGSMQCDRIDYDAVVARCGGACGICGLPTGPKFDFDHIIPVTKDGPHTEANLQVAHPVCNKLKSNKIGFRIRPVPEIYVSC